jgi:hypothetical protein
MPKKRQMRGGLTMILNWRGNLGEVHRLLNTVRAAIMRAGNFLCQRIPLRWT